MVTIIQEVQVVDAGVFVLVRLNLGDEMVDVPLSDEIAIDLARGLNSVMALRERVKKESVKLSDGIDFDPGPA